jgi:hypothetical protein
MFSSVKPDLCDNKIAILQPHNTEFNENMTTFLDKKFDKLYSFLESKLKILNNTSYE